MGAACCAGSALSGSSFTSSGSLLALPLALFELSPRLSLFVTTFLLLLGGTGYILLVLLTPADIVPSPQELLYMTKHGEEHPLPTLQDPASVQLSVVIPAYNERERLPIMLEEAVTWLEGVKLAKESLSGSHRDALSSYELILIDDGSKDGTHQVALDFASSHPNVDIRVVRLVRNRGKGGAVRHGILHSRGQIILFADADGATRFSDLRHLSIELDRIRTKLDHAIVVGSRAHMVKSEAVVKRSFIRNFLMHSFHIFLSILLRPPTPTLPSFAKRKRHTVQKLPSQPVIKDTQCGFKLFTRNSARTVFPFAHIDRWIFDVELLILAEMVASLQARVGEGEELLRLGLPVGEVPVQWHEVGGSKIDLVKDSIGMALDLLIIRANYATGRWKAPTSLCT